MRESFVAAHPSPDESTWQCVSLQNSPHLFTQHNSLVGIGGHIISINSSPHSTQLHYLHPPSLATHLPHPLSYDNRAITPPPSLESMLATSYIRPELGCAAGDLCKYATSAASKMSTPQTRYQCFNCNGTVHQEMSCAETIETVLEDGHTIQYDYLSPHGIAKFQDQGGGGSINAIINLKEEGQTRHQHRRKM